MATALVCGAFVMVVEVMGSRVIGPFFGVSLFVWTALIAVTLMSLAAGYAAGGLLSYRRGTPDLLYGLILAAGVLAFLIPVLRAPVLRATVPLGLRNGALASAAILFGPTLCLLGCVSPLLVRISTRELDTVGRTAGALYALSTIGSLVGTVVTGFVLVAWLGVERIFQLVGLILMLLAVAWFVLVRRRLLAVLPLALALIGGNERELVTKVLPNGTRLEEVHRWNGLRGSIRVVDYSKSGLRVRDLVLEGQIQGGMDLATGLSAYPYTYFLQFLPWAARPGGSTCLVVGLGAGLIPRWYEDRGVRTDVVEINPNVVATAQQFFGFGVSGDVVVDDARHFLATTRRRYDYVILDAFSGDTTPSHLLSREALSLVAERLTPDGIFAMNFIGRVDGKSPMTSSVLHTLRAVFPTVSVHAISDAKGTRGEFANLAFVATSMPALAYDPEHVSAFPVHPLAGKLDERLFTPEEPLPSPEAHLLTDNHNPLEVQDVELKEAMRLLMLASTDWDVLL